MTFFRILPLLFLFSLFSCVGVVEDASVPIVDVGVNDEVNFQFAGVENAIAVSLSLIHI